MLGELGSEFVPSAGSASRYRLGEARIIRTYVRKIGLVRFSTPV